MYRPTRAPIEALGRERTVRAGEVLFFEDDPCEYVYELREGIARGVSFMPSGERQISAFFFAGDQIGLPVGTTYRYTAEAVTPVRYVRHSRARWHEALVRDGGDGRRLLQSIGAEQDPIFRRGIIIGRHGLLVRICAFLMLMMDRLPSDGASFVFPLTQADIAAYLATTPESVCRGFRLLREMGMIAMPRRDRLRVIDRAAIEATASGAPAWSAELRKNGPKWENRLVRRAYERVCQSRIAGSDRAASSLANMVNNATRAFAPERLNRVNARDRSRKITVIYQVYDGTFRGLSSFPEFPNDDSTLTSRPSDVGRRGIDPG